MDSPALQGLVKSFRGKCVGIGLRRRGENDPHVLFEILLEDDEYWFIPQNFQASSYWLPELQDCLQQAQDWMNRNCDKDGEWGYKFREREVADVN